jgi:hypothetical protein
MGDSTALVIRLARPSVSIVNNGNGTVTVSMDQVPLAHLQSTPSLPGTPTWTDLGTTTR